MNRSYAKNKDGVRLMVWEEEFKTLSDKLGFLCDLGFIVAHFLFYSKDRLNDYIETLKDIAQEKQYPIDGLVFKYDNIEYYNSLGSTSHHARGGLAYKFYDETYETTLRDIEWTMGRTGVLTPVAIFDEVDTGDAKITRANLHNISIMEELLGEHPYIGQKIEIAMQNMIIPQVIKTNKNSAKLVEGD